MRSSVWSPALVPALCLLLFPIHAHAASETRAQVAHGDLKAPPTDPFGPAVSIAGVASFGTLSGSPTRRQNTLYEVVDNLSHQAGAHALRAGIDVLFNDDTITFPRSIRGAYTFSTMANFLSGTHPMTGPPGRAKKATDSMLLLPSSHAHAAIHSDLHRLIRSSSLQPAAPEPTADSDSRADPV